MSENYNNIYIGARYVPVFAEPTEWDNTRSYQPLTIVTHEGDSYTSKTFVPIGIDISNETYWVITGNFNAQVEQYRQEVVQVKNDVDDVSNKVDGYDTRITNNTDNITSMKTSISNIIVKNNEQDNEISDIQSEINNIKTAENRYGLDGKKILILGDSISDQSAGSWKANLIPNWVDRLETILGSENITNNSASSRAFTTTSVPGLYQIIDDITGNYDIIIVFCGVNDYLQGKNLGNRNSGVRTNYNGAMNHVGDVLKTKYYNSQIYFVSPLKTTYVDDNTLPFTTLDMYRQAMYDFCKVNNFHYISGYDFPNYNPNISQYDVFSDDGLHPINTYSQKLCDYILYHIAYQISDECNQKYSIQNASSLIKSGSGLTSLYIVSKNEKVGLYVASTNNMATGFNAITNTLPHYFVSWFPSGYNNIPCSIQTTDGYQHYAALYLDSSVLYLTTQTSGQLRGYLEFNSNVLSSYDSYSL